jgi:pimeloyl-ACP methyl ester carboxylesterase
VLYVLHGRFSSISAHILLGAHPARRTSCRMIRHRRTVNENACTPCIMKTITVDNLVIAYRSAGDAKRPALILLHGWPHSSAIYQGVLEDLGPHSYVLAFDLPGVGDSRGAPPSAEKVVLADIVLRAAAALGATDTIVAGFDVGGMIAYAAARDHAARIVGAVVANTVIPGIAP